LLLIRSQHAEIIVVKRLIQGRHNRQTNPSHILVLIAVGDRMFLGMQDFDFAQT